MSDYPRTPIAAEFTAPCEIRTDNKIPLLHEVRHALHRLVRYGETHSIDLNSIPLTPMETEEMEKFLGNGEVSIQINSFGKTSIQETRFHGVWLIMHFNEGGLPESRFIEISTVPGIVLAQTDDISQSESDFSRLMEGLHNDH